MLSKLIDRVRRSRKKATPEPEHIRHKGQHVSRAVFDEVKHSIKLLGQRRGYEDMAAIARSHNIGRTTAYKIKNSPTYGHYIGTAKKLTVTGGGRTHRVAVTAR